MRVASVSDLHLDHAANRELMPALASAVHRRGADLVVIAGDVSHLDVWIDKAIRSFQVVAPAVAYLPGNHDLWQAPERLTAGADTWVRYHEDLRELVTGLGATYLPAEPYRRGSVAVAGSCGWYDYGFLSEDLRPLLTDEVRQTKQLERAQWSDARFVRFRREDGGIMPDEDVSNRMIAELSSQLDALDRDPAVERVMVAVHHLPFEDVVFRTGTLPWEFFNAFMGSPRLGEALIRYPKVTSVLYGHTHRGREVTVSGRRVLGTPLGYPRERMGLSPEDVVASRIGWWEL